MKLMVILALSLITGCASTSGYYDRVRVCFFVCVDAEHEVKLVTPAPLTPVPETKCKRDEEPV